MIAVAAPPLGFRDYPALVREFTSTFFRGSPVTVYLDPSRRAWNRWRPVAQISVVGTFEAHAFIGANGRLGKKPAGYPAR